MEDKPPTLDELLEGCKRMAISDYQQKGGRRSVRDNFINSVIDACITADARYMFVPPFHSKLHDIRLDSLESFEAGIDRVFGYIREQAGLR